MSFNTPTNSNNTPNPQKEKTECTYILPLWSSFSSILLYEIPVYNEGNLRLCERSDSGVSLHWATIHSINCTVPWFLVQADSKVQLVFFTYKLPSNRILKWREKEWLFATMPSYSITTQKKTLQIPKTKPQDFLSSYTTRALRDSFYHWKLLHPPPSPSREITACMLDCSQ